MKLDGRFCVLFDTCSVTNNTDNQIDATITVY